MGRKGRQSLEKRRLDKLRQERQAAKRERRQAPREADGAEPVDETQLLERFRELGEQHAAGAIDEETFRVKRHEVLVALGFESADDE